MIHFIPSDFQKNKSASCTSGVVAVFKLTIKPGQLTLADLRRVAREAVELHLDPACHQ